VVLSGLVLTATISAMVTGVAAAAPATPNADQPAPHTSLAAVAADVPHAHVPPRVTVPQRSSAATAGLTSDRIERVARTKARTAAAARSARPTSHSTQRQHASGTPLDRAVGRIPGYGVHRPARWVLTSRYGHWGATDLGNNTVYISPSVPASKLDSVVRHEWSHILTIRAYGGVSSALAGTNSVFGGSGMTGVERAADCMARQLGATWTNYTSCSSATWQRAASALLRGRRP
jgi:hypothetical protein